MRNWGLLVCLVAACSGGNGGAGVPCGELDGAYLATFSERSGNCGSFEGVVVFGDAADDDGSMCSNEPTMTACDVEFDEDCEFDNGTSSSLAGTLSQVAGPERVEGILESTQYRADGSLACRSVYDVTMERQ